MVKVLVVDDTDFMRNQIHKFLGAARIQVIDECDSGEQALIAVAMEQYDIIVMNIYMPGISGIETVVKIREQGIDTPILMSTTDCEKDTVIHAIHAGANNYLIKPFTLEQLLYKLKKTLNPDKAVEIQLEEPVEEEPLSPVKEETVPEARVSQLTPGMVILQHIKASKGQLLIPAGTKLTSDHVGKIKQLLNQNNVADQMIRMSPKMEL